MELMLESRHNLESIPLLFRDGKMKMFDASWTKVCVDIDTACKKNTRTLNFDVFENHLGSQKLLSLVKDEIFRFREELSIFDLPTSIPTLNNIKVPPAGIWRDWYVNTTIPPDEGIELIDGEDGDIEELQRELQMIADSEEEINLIIVDPATYEMDASKAIVENLINTVSKIVHEVVNWNQDMVFSNKLLLLLRQGKHETS